MSNEISKLSGQSLANSFDYSMVDSLTANFLQGELQKMNQIAQDTRYKMGKELSVVRDRLSSHYQGVFTKWYESLGLDRHDVYFWINEFEFSQNLENTKQIANFDSIPKTLKKDVMSKSSSGEAKEAVLNGDIKTHKEFIELEKKLKQKEQAIQDKDSQISKQAEMIDSLNEREPQVVEKTVTVEKIPDDYEAIKQKAQQADSIKEQLEKAQQQADYFKKESESAKQLIKIQDDEADQKRLERLKRKADINIYTLSSNIKSFLNENMLLDDDLNQLSEMSEEAKINIDSRLEELQKFVDLIKQTTTGRKVIEGSFN